VIDFRARTKNDAKPLAQSSYNSIVYRDEDAATLLLTIGFDTSTPDKGSDLSNNFLITTT